MSSKRVSILQFRPSLKTMYYRIVNVSPIPQSYTGDDGIGIKILKIAAPAIVPSLTRVLNLCLTKKHFPRAWKIAKVSPIFKGNGSRNDKECFRPISVLPILSKLLEKLICRSMNKFLRENNILHKFQSGFRKTFSTETALVRLVDLVQLLFDLDKNSVSGIVFVDYKKAFDLIDHQLLLRKLEVLGIGDDYLPLFTSFLSDRKQYVNVNGCHSKTENVNFGVPQGSILGPVLFLIFINDLPTALKNSTADIYADDTTISYSDHYNISPQAISNGIQTDMNELQNWSNINRMTLN